MGDVPAAPSEPRGIPHRLPRLLKLLSILGILAVIAVLGGHQLAGKYKLIKPIQYIGHSDEAAYATAGLSLSQGKGLEVRYISEFFIPYSPNITRHEDHWPPFMGLCIAPCYYLLGFHTWVAKLPAIFFGSIGLPLTTALLAYALSRRGYVAIVAGLLMMIHPDLYEASLGTLSDLSVGMLLAGFCGSVILAQRHPWMHLIAGAFLALAYFAKGSQLILFGIYPLMAVLCAGPRVLLRKPVWGGVWGGIAVALLLIAPYWYANWRSYGNPLHSVQNYISGFYGLDDWDEVAYYPFWGKNLPQTSDRWNKYGKTYWQHAAENREEVAADAITGRGTSDAFWLDYGQYGIWFRDLLLPARKPTFYGQFLGGRPPPQAAAVAPRPIAKWAYPATELPAAGSVLLLVVLLAASPFTFAIIFWNWRKRRRQPASSATSPPGASPAAKTIRPPWMLGPVLALSILIVMEGAFIAYFWDVQPRFCYLFLPFFAALGCTAASRFIEWPLHGLLIAGKSAARWLLRKSQHGTLRLNEFLASARFLRHWHLVLTLLFAVMLLLKYQGMAAWIDKTVFQGVRPTLYDELTVPRMGEWIAKNAPDAIIMCRNPWELLYYCSPTNKAIGSPNPRNGGQKGADQILAIAHYYGVTHLYADSVRGALAPYLSGRDGAFKRVPGAPGPLYEIDWSKIKVKTPEEALAEK